MEKRTIAAAVAFTVVAVFFLFSIFLIHPFGRPGQVPMDDHIIQHTQNETGTNNAVTSVVFDYRGFDTLGEATILFSAVAGVPPHLPAGEVMSEMTKIVKTTANILFPLTMIFGLYVIAHGHLTPGGGFQGGAIVASGCALLLVAYGSPWVFDRIKEKRLAAFESMGAIGFIVVALLGLVFSAVFFGNFLAGSGGLFGTTPATGSTLADFNTGGVLPLMNFAVGVKVIAGLFVIVLVMAYASSIKEWRS